MAWEMQSQYEQYIIPSIQKAMESHGDEAAQLEWVVERYADAHYTGGPLSLWRGYAVEARDIAARVDIGTLIEAIADKVCEHRLTTTGAHEVYLGDIDCQCIEWCTEEEMLQWWANN